MIFRFFKSALFSLNIIFPFTFLLLHYIGCSFILKVGVEESIVNAPRITDHGSAV
jgi:hypothetical protein